MSHYFTYRIGELALKGEKAFIETEATKNHEYAFTGYAIIWGGEPDYNGFTISKAALDTTLNVWHLTHARYYKRGCLGCDCIKVAGLASLKVSPY